MKRQWAVRMLLATALPLVGAGIAASIWLNVEASGLIVLTAIAIFLTASRS